VPHIENLHTAIVGSGHEEPATVDIGCQMIKPAVNAGQRHSGQ